MVPVKPRFGKPRYGDSGRRGVGLAADIEQGCLLLGNIEIQIEQHLLMHGLHIDAKTRWFLAQIRDAAGAAAEGSRRRAEACDHDPGAAHMAPVGDAGRALIPAAAGDGGAQTRPEEGSAQDAEARGLSGRVSRWRAATHLGVGTACGVLLTVLALGHRAPPEAGMDRQTGVWTVGQPASSPPDAAVSTVLARLSVDRGLRLMEMAPQEPSLLSMRGTMERRAGAGRPARGVNAAPAVVTASIDPKATAAAEGRLDLSLRERRQIQRRLTLAGFDPKVVDGILGPATRAAIRDWQAASGRLATGHLAGATRAALEAETEALYRAWQVAERKFADQRSRRTAALESPVPPRAPEGGNACARHPSGEVVYGQGVGCDFKGLKEDIAQLFRGPSRSRDFATAAGDGKSGGA